MAEDKPRVLSGIQPTGKMHLGNYVGALSQFIELQYEAECFYPIVDLHALTVERDPKRFKQEVIQTANIYLAAGIDTDECALYLQSHVPEHTELTWLLNCIASYGDLRRMTQFKDKAEKQDLVSAGLFDYPVLMAADILIYDADLVPVGDDQKQHLELTRDIAERFNSYYGEVFKLPEPMIKEKGSRIMALNDPESKMSKSAKSKYNYVALLDDPDEVEEKIMRAVTDSGREIRYDEENKAGISNLLTIYSEISGKDIARLEEEYEGRGYGHLKQDLVEVVNDFLDPIREEYERLADDPGHTMQILEEGRRRAARITEEKIKEVKAAMGLHLPS